MEHEVSAFRTPVGLSVKLYAHEHYFEMTGVPALETSLSAPLAWGGLSMRPTLTRLWAWQNGSFRGDRAIEPGWLASLTILPGQDR